MIHPLRKRHRRLWCVLGVLLPAGLGAALLARTEPPASAAALRAPGLQGVPRELRLAEDLLLELWDGAGPSPLLAVRLRSVVERPTVLLYWSPAMPSDGTLPAQARLLGPVSNDHARLLPSPGPAGALLLYSLADGVLLGSAQLPAQVGTS